MMPKRMMTIDDDNFDKEDDDEDDDDCKQSSSEPITEASSVIKIVCLGCRQESGLAKTLNVYVVKEYK